MEIHMENPKPLKFISVNIEKHRHVDRVLSFLGNENPDVICFQEILGDDFPTFLEATGFKGTFVPMARFPLKLDVDKDTVISGIATISRFPMEMETHYYYGSPDFVPDFIHADQTTNNRMLLVSKLNHNGKKFIIGNTHFTWTPNGEMDEWQRKDISSLMNIMQKFPEIILCGDMNAPRGRETFDIFASKYKDNIPVSCTTTIDKNLHIAGDLQYVVDALFTTPKYEAKNVRLQDGVSDHMAVVAELF